MSGTLNLKKLRQGFKALPRKDQERLTQKVYDQKMRFDIELSEMLENQEISWAIAKKVHAIAMNDNPMWRVVLNI